jgi:deoxycytidine triphosphate deaminase
MASSKPHRPTKPFRGADEHPFFENDAEAETRFERYESCDPFPNILPALLNSADIFDYALATGMLAPFYPTRLKSASYEAALLGPLVYWDAKDQAQYLDLHTGDPFVLEKNSIAFVTVEPTFRIPDYIALRFNLRINLVHRGILLGTGPLVDPGFVGKLLIPLHNLTNNDYPLVGGDPLIWIEFTKLSPNSRWDKLTPAATFGRYREFPKDKRNLEIPHYLKEAADFKPIQSSIGGELVRVTSVATAAQQRVEELENKIRRYSLWGAVALIIAIVGMVIAAIIASPSFVSLLVQTQSVANQAQDEMNKIQGTAHHFDRRNQDLRKQITDLQKKLDLMDGKGGAPKKNTAVSRPRPNP